MDASPHLFGERLDEDFPMSYRMKIARPQSWLDHRLPKRPQLIKHQKATSEGGKADRETGCKISKATKKRQVSERRPSPQPAKPSVDETSDRSIPTCTGNAPQQFSDLQDLFGSDSLRSNIPTINAQKYNVHWVLGVEV